MELKYIWVDEFNVLENLDLNFSHTGEHSFSYKDSQLITTQKRPLALKFGEKVTSVTAIAGQNGSGKTSMCELVVHIAATLVNGAMSYQTFFKGILCIGNYIFHHKDTPINNIPALRNDGYNVQEFDKTPFEKIDFENRPEFFKLGFIYFSNMLDWRSGFDLMNLANYSTEELLNRDIHTGTYKLKKGFGQSATPNYIGAYYDGQGYRHTKFYLNFPGHIPFPPPVTFVLKHTYSGNNKMLDFEDSSFTYKDYSEFNTIEQDILSQIYNHYPKVELGVSLTVDQNLFKAAVKALYRLNVLKAIAKDEGDLPDLKSANSFIFGESDIIPNYNEPELTELLETHSDLIDIGYFYDVWSHSDPDDKTTYDIGFKALEVFYIENTENSRNLIRTLMDLENRVVNRKHHYGMRLLNYNFYPHNSSGEYNFYTLFSRLYAAIQRYVNDPDKRKTIVLILDEADIGFHPVWKKKLLKWVVSFLNGEFNPYQFQLIFTTHSPYLLSDLHSDNLILLSNVGGESRLAPMTDRFTFGANINELLADNFFMNEGLIGDFAKDNIQGVIDRLNTWREIKERTNDLSVEQRERDHCLNIISIIGDTIVRQKLFEMFHELFRSEAILDGEIASLEKRVAYLKTLRK